ncbi:cobalt-precorrin-5B (C(1))-methyltransferase [Streptomyces sp. t39]|uniref:cobalt-precorrin-5B (C(1))-methyltransferase n=1 Tax=Streptomyces sp. t39 TaxID=1828156 RepID=UPI0011CECB7A|nr:cobalt-precorrin-5B (C(1))-methyltransferase [Streptomyces sp. t39]TXS55221.1 hypothetical protein EAO77_02670 [Streptomyces sp. t39]
MSTNPSDSGRTAALAIDALGRMHRDAAAISRVLTQLLADAGDDLPDLTRIQTQVGYSDYPPCIRLRAGDPDVARAWAAHLGVTLTRKDVPTAVIDGGSRHYAGSTERDGVQVEIGSCTNYYGPAEWSAALAETPADEAEVTA